MSDLSNKMALQASRQKSFPNVPQRTASKEGNRSRSVSGCWTCRLRRKKCDETGPECITCTERGLKCSGFGAIKPRWMDGGAQQEAVHQEIKATVASVTRMKRMMKLVQSREKASPGPRSTSIPPELFNNVSGSFYIQDSCSSGPSRAASVGPTRLNSLPSQNTQPWVSSEVSPDWNFNTFPHQDETSFFRLADGSYNSLPSSFPAPVMNENCFYPPTTNGQDTFYHYSTPEPDSYLPSTTNSSGLAPNYAIFPQTYVFPPSPVSSVTTPDKPDMKFQTPRRLQEIFPREDNSRQNYQERMNFPARNPQQMPLSPVCENGPAQNYDMSVKKPVLLLPKAECPRPTNQVYISSLELSAQQNWIETTNKLPSSPVNPRLQQLISANVELSRLVDLLRTTENQERDTHLKDAISWVLRIRDDYLTECEHSTARVLSNDDLSSLGSSIRFALWTDITTRTFESAEVESPFSPFRGHITRLLEASINTQQAYLGPTESWIFTGIESVTRLAQMRAELAREGIFGHQESQQHESAVLRNLEYHLDNRDSLTPLDPKTALRRSIFLHTIMIYFHLVVQGPNPESFEIRKHVDIVIRDLVALNDPQSLSTDFVWPFLVAGSMAGPEHHQALHQLFSTNRFWGSPTKRFSNAWQIVQECWVMRGQGLCAEWKSARDNLVAKGYTVDTACW
ncbi:hypothetical protein HYALB_00005693 [Hymenoscyphus albidus]|uniref:Zn(2)-C6 fungal-type domain-containing protein n=1 Tax=Hymenoscyphus albidus TaxID=595503 RepID=A0A9N9LKF1_9HELO|nr:hypothetical protein HYALB_00005693 [Hymenoscyphus albidus]